MESFVPARWVGVRENTWKVRGNSLPRLVNVWICRCIQRMLSLFPLMLGLVTWLGINSVGLIRRAVGEGKEECESGKIIGLYYVAQASPFFIRAHRIASWGRESVIIRSNFGGEAWAAHRWRKVANIPTRRWMIRRPPFNGFLFPSRLHQE